MKLGSIFLGSWLILTSLVSLVGLHFRYDVQVLGGLALVAGVFVLIRR